MTLFEKILREMKLYESVSVDDINSAIDNHERILIDYHSVEDEDAGPRIVDVYAYGLTKKGNPVIRCFQPFGNTMSKVPAWKFFLVDGIKKWQNTNQNFMEPADGFNPYGDKSMSTVLKITSFDNDETHDINTPQNGPKLRNDKLFKTDTEKRIERLRNQLNNPINISDLKLKQGFKGLEKSSNATTGPKISNNNVKTNVNDKEKELQQLKNKLGDTSKPMTFSELYNKLNNNDVYKTDTENNMERLRQQLKNPQKIDLNQIPKK